MNNKIQPKTKEELKEIIQNEIKQHGSECDLNHIDVSLIKNMTELFYDSKFNGNISQWDVSKVIDMEGMFYYSLFNGDISKWNVSNVEYMNSMFSESVFNNDISQWNISHVADMSYMFQESLFNGDLSNWQPLKLEEYDNMFYKCICQIPYWYSENVDEIPKRIKQYQESKILEKKLNRTLIVNLNEKKKIKL